VDCAAEKIENDTTRETAQSNFFKMASQQGGVYCCQNYNG
jgi:hypothetical protein